jgi:3',5'-cyclic-nucleotide phosphodiesterase
MALHRPRPVALPKAYHLSPGPGGPSHVFGAPQRRFDLVGNPGTRNPTTGSYHRLQALPAMSVSEDMSSWDMWIDDVFCKCTDKPFTPTLEQALGNLFDADRVIYWQHLPSSRIFYSETMNLVSPYDVGLVGLVHAAGQPTKIPAPFSHPAFQSAIDGRVVLPDSNAFLFPLANRNNDLVAIVEIVKDTDFTVSELKFAQWFSRKFKHIHPHLDIPKNTEQLAADINGLSTEDVFCSRGLPRIREEFGCRDVEVWKYDQATRALLRLSVAGRTDINVADGGIPFESIRTSAVINCARCKSLSAWRLTADGDSDAPVLCVPAQADGAIWAVVLRSPRRLVFTQQDEARLVRLAPVICKGASICNSGPVPDSEVASLRSELNSLRSLIDVLELISSELNPDKLVSTIMEKGRTLTNADRCSLFLVNPTRDRLITYLQTGLVSAIDIPIDAGIAGRCVSGKVLINIPDAYTSPWFDPSTDKGSGYRTKSLIAVPIYSHRGEIIGCTELINKMGSMAFNDWDAKLIQLFNVFCGISIENARLYTESIDLHEHMKGLLDTAFSLSKSEEIHKMLSDILQNAKKAVGADRASFFVLKEGTAELSSFIVDGPRLPGTIPLDKGLAGYAIRTQKVVLENDCYQNGNFNMDVDRESGYHTKSLIALPVFDNTGNVLGVVEVLNKIGGDFTQKDIELVSAFTTFASVALQNSRVQTVQQVGGIEAEILKWITPSERSAYEIPVALELSDQEKETVMSMACFAVDFKGIGHFKEIFFFFRTFNFLELFDIAAERFFRFLSEISSRYTGTSYHNWTHACDVSQCIFFMLYKGRLGDSYEAWELFTLLVAAVCHDTNHYGFNNVFNVKAETPLGILFKDQSVMEIHHITQSIPVINQDDVALFHHFSQAEVRKVWGLFIRIILSTDMARHFELVKKAQAAVDEQNFDMADEEFRLLGLQLIMKVGDISNVSRPFEIADKWCDILNQEFFRQGDLEKETGIGLTSPLNDRETSNKPKSQIGFYNFICLPLYIVVARLYPPLQVNVDSVKANLDRWKGIVASQAAAPKT